MHLFDAGQIFSRVHFQTFLYSMSNRTFPCTCMSGGMLSRQSLSKQRGTVYMEREDLMELLKNSTIFSHFVQ